MIIIDYHPASDASGAESATRQSQEKLVKKETQKSEILERLNSQRAALPPIEDKMIRGYGSGGTD